MKKKTLALLLIITCVLPATACGAADAGEAEGLTRASEAREELEKEFSDEEPEEVELEVKEEVESEKEEKEDEKEAKKLVAAPSELSDDLYDFQISIDGTVYQFPMWYSDFEAFGWEYSGDSTEILEPGRWDMPPSLWHKEGYGAYVILSNPTSEHISYSESMVSGILLMDAFLTGCDWEILLPGGIQYDISNVDDIKAAYGEPSDEPDNTGYTMIYTYEGDPDRKIELSVYSDSNTLRFILVQNVIRVDSPKID